MIEDIEIANFQSHQDSQLSLCPGVNVITGRSESGKTAIMRALGWWYSNRPQGFAFRSDFSGKDDSTRVGIAFKDGNWVIRERNTKGINCYQTATEGMLSSLGTDVPLEVSSILNLADYNIQHQHDKYFLLQNTSGEVAKALNDIAGLDIIDTCLSKINSIIIRTKERIKDSDEQIQVLQEQLKEYVGIDGWENLVTALEKALVEREERKTLRRELFRITREVNDLTADIDSVNNWLEVENDANDILKETENISGLQTMRYRVSELIDEIIELNEEIKGDDFFIGGEVMVNELLKDCKEVGIMTGDSGFINSIIEDVDELESDIGYLVAKLEKKKEDYIGFVEQFNSCPICGSEISAKSLLNIKEVL